MNYCISQDFHDTYENLYEHIVVVRLKDGTTVEGGWYDEFFEDAIDTHKHFGSRCENYKNIGYTGNEAFR